MSDVHPRGQPIGVIRELSAELTQVVRCESLGGEGTSVDWKVSLGQ